MWQIGLLLGCLTVALAETQAAAAVEPSTALEVPGLRRDLHGGKSKGIYLLELDPASGR